MELHYTAHYNWQWVVTAAHERLQATYPRTFTTTNDCKRFSMLPSIVDGPKVKAEYALIRVDLVNTSNRVVQYKVRMTSQGFADLDPKDALFRRLKDSNAADCMPKSFLFAWDANEGDIPNPLPLVPSFLKAPMGSGGFGLYYVYHPRDIFPIMHNHRMRAEREPKFMENLIQSYEGAAPSWSLQEVISSVKGSVPTDDADATSEFSLAKRRTQIRVYVVLCGDHLFLYDGIEVRMPLWDCDIDAVLADETSQFSGDTTLSAVDTTTDDDDDTKSRRRRRPWSDAVEEECCGSGNARPYNEQRNKRETRRYMLEEIPELRDARDSIIQCTHKAFRAMGRSILNRHRKYSAQPEAHSGGNEVPMAVVGVDLLATQESQDTADKESNAFRVVMVEVNNNPAMPGSNKRMSPLYREHLITMVSSIIELGIVEAWKQQAPVDESDSWDRARLMESVERRFQIIV